MGRLRSPPHCRRWARRSSPPPGTPPPAVGLGVGRSVLAAVALLVAPFFYKDHFLWVATLRPTKEILLGGGFLVREGDLFLLPLVLVALPLLLGGVWLSYLLGVSYRAELQERELPGLAGTCCPVPACSTSPKPFGPAAGDSCSSVVSQHSHRASSPPQPERPHGPPEP